MQNRNKNQFAILFQLRRLVNFIVDSITIYIISVFTLLLLGKLAIKLHLLTAITREDKYVVLPIVYCYSTLIGFFYYFLMEYKLKRTVGKFLTRTKVISSNGAPITSAQILKRTFCRLIPFEQILYLVKRDGLHDKVSRTQVVSKKADSAK